MGLDLFHAHAKSEVDKQFFRVDRSAEELKSPQNYFQEYGNPHINWEKMFADRGLVYQKYRVMGHSTDGKHSCFVFVDADAVGINHPIRAVFSNEWQFSLLPRFMQRSKFRLAKVRPSRYFFGPFVTVMKTETVIFYDVVGYQRNGVSQEFYHHFRPDDVTCLEYRVEAIYQSASSDLRESFKRNFMDNWIDGRSFLIISY
jgi:hypothetical protein